MTTLAKQCAELAETLSYAVGDASEALEEAKIKYSGGYKPDRLKYAAEQLEKLKAGEQLLRQLSELLAQDGREAFELFILSGGHGEYWAKSVLAREGEHYHHDNTQIAWSAWQAARAPLLVRIAELEQERRAWGAAKIEELLARIAELESAQLPTSNSPAAGEAINAMMASRDWPCSPAAAARAGFEAARQLLNNKEAA